MCLSRTRAAVFDQTTKSPARNRPHCSRSAPHNLVFNLLAVAVAVFLGAGEARAQELSGRLLDLASGEPIVAGLLTLLMPDSVAILTAVSDRDGNWTLQPDTSGHYFILVRRLGYQASLVGPLELRRGQNLSGVYHLRRLPVKLEPIDVSAIATQRYLDEAGFYQRRNRGLGAFLDRADIENRPGAPRRLAYLLATIPGVRTYSDGGIRLRGLGPQCEFRRPLVWIDGFRIFTGDCSDWHELVNPQDIEAVELFRRPVEVPPEFNNGGNAGCGVILIWTRRGVG